MWAQNCNSLSTNYYGNSISDSSIISGYENIIMSGVKLFGAVELLELSNMCNMVAKIPLLTNMLLESELITNRFIFNISGVDYADKTKDSGQIYWSSDNVLMFGIDGNNLLSLGKLFRRVNKIYYYPILSPSIDVKILRFQVYFQNNYNDALPMSGKMQIKIIRTNRCQYIYINVVQLPEDIGEWYLKIGDSFIDLAKYVENKANFVIESDLNGNNWKVHEKSYFFV